VPPQVVDEEQIFTFKFWFNEVIHYGMYHRNELFCRLEVYDIQQRSLVYQIGCQLSQKDNTPIILSCATNTCSLWGSLRSDAVKELLLHPEHLHELAAASSPNFGV